MGSPSQPSRSEYPLPDTNPLAQRMEFVLENLKDHAIFLIDGEDLISTWNKGAERVFGFKADEAIGKPFSLIFTPEDIQAGVPGGELSTARETGKAEDERWHQRKDGSRFWASGAVVPVLGEDAPFHYIKIVRDATDRKRAEDADRMESIGRLAGGVAHDYNNMLTSIIGYCELLSASLEEGTRDQDWLAEILASANRAAALTQDLLAFSRKQMVKPEAVNLNGVIGKMRGMLRTTLGPQIRLIIDADPAVEDAILDRGQIGQVLMNLALNAREAMPDGGSVTITTISAKATADSSAGASVAGAASAASDTAALSAASLANTGEIMPGPRGAKDVSPPKAFVTLVFKDTGVGMDAETAAHAFDPFFSTKPQAAGSVGLGLSTGYGIIQQSGGTISVTSVMGEGTEFVIRLPIIGVGEPHASPQVADPGISKPARRGISASRQETILLVEDEAAVRRLAGEVLRSSGFKIMEAGDGLEGLALFEKHMDEISIVLTDVVMPNMGGLAMARKMLSRKPDTSFVFMSGYSDDLDLDKEHARSLFLHKPFSVSGLLDRVEKAIAP